MNSDYRIYNIYYMLAYAFDDSKMNNIEESKVNAEKFKYIYDLFAFMLTNITGKLIKRGLFKNYINESDELNTVKGRINLTESIKKNTFTNKKIVCEYDDYSENNYLNQIIKTTIYYLLSSNKLTKKYSDDLKKVYSLLNTIDMLNNIYLIRWDAIIYNRNNRNYKFIINLCYMIINGLLVNKYGGNVELMDFINGKTLSSLFESFVRKYYQVEYKGKLTASGETINWQINEEYENNKMIDLLPQMHTDITLRHGNKELIIDTKFYDKTISKSGFNGSEKETIKSNNWYQINSYVTNKVYEYNKQNINIEVAGMLLYAKTDEEISPDIETKVMGSKMYVKTIDLNTNFKNIEKQLYEIGLLVNNNLKERIGSLSNSVGEQ